MCSRSLIFMLVGAASLPLARVKAAVFTVTSRFDFGDGTLRQAITDANAAAESAIINFHIDGVGVQTITLSGALPDVTVPTLIDGTTQPGFAGAPLILLDGNQRAIPAALRFTVGGNTVRSLIINNVGKNDPGDGILLTGPGGNTITGCWLGLDATGTTTRRIRGADIHILNSPNNHLGGVTAAEGNVLSGSGSSAGVLIEGAGSTGNVVSGNTIGLDVSGSLSRENIIGVVIDNAPNNVIGGTVPGARNVISGNFTEEVLIKGIGATGNVFQANFIGLKADGTALYPSIPGEHGLVINGAPGNVIGGPSAGAGNVVANVNFGIQVTGADAKLNVIQGNRIGTDPTGMHAIPNATGLRIASGASGNSVGGTEPGMGNLISGNRTFGVTISDASNNFIQGNLVGTDVTGNTALPNGPAGASSSGISIASITGPAENNFIGGHLPGVRNVISGNNDAGVTLVGDVRHTTLAGNFIGPGADGVTIIGNAGIGVAVLGASDNTIGGPDDWDANWIVGNGGPLKNPGVFLGATFGSVGTPGTGNLVQKNYVGQNTGPGVTLFFPNQVSQNVYFGNGGLPIDRFGDGPTPNTLLGPGNFPECDLLSTNSEIFTITVNLEAAKDCHYSTEVYLTRQSVLGSYAGPVTFPVSLAPIQLHTDAAGTGTTPHVVIAFPLEPGDLLNATAFAPGCGDGTSEFGPAVGPVNPRPPGIEFERSSYQAKEGTGNLTVKLVRNGNLSSPSSVRLQAVSNDSNAYGQPAVADRDFVPADRRVTFAAGEANVEVEIEIKNDDVYTGAKAFQIRLTDPVNAELTLTMFGPAETAIVGIVDDDPPTQPFYLALDGHGVGDLQLRVTSPVPEAVVIEIAEIGESHFGWTTAGIIPAGQTAVTFAPEEINEALRAKANWDLFLATITIVGPDGQPATDLNFQLGKFAPAIPAAQLPPSQAVPAGAVEMVVSKTTTSTDPVSGQPVIFRNTIEMIHAVVDSFIAALKAEVKVEKVLPPECPCTPWAGAVGGMIGGVQKVVLGGGKNGKCDEAVSVRVTGPGVPDEALKPDKRGRYRKTFDPAANGEWTVTSIVCGKTNTARISLP